MLPSAPPAEPARRQTAVDAAAIANEALETRVEKKSVTFLQDDRQLSKEDCSECSRLEFQARSGMIVKDNMFGPLGQPPR